MFKLDYLTFTLYYNRTFLHHIWLILGGTKQDMLPHVTTFLVWFLNIFDKLSNIYIYVIYIIYIYTYLKYNGNMW